MSPQRCCDVWAAIAANRPESGWEAERLLDKSGNLDENQALSLVKAKNYHAKPESKFADKDLQALEDPLTPRECYRLVGNCLYEAYRGKGRAFFAAHDFLYERHANKIDPPLLQGPKWRKNFELIPDPVAELDAFYKKVENRLASREKVA